MCLDTWNLPRLWLVATSPILWVPGSEIWNFKVENLRLGNTLNSSRIFRSTVWGPGKVIMNTDANLEIRSFFRNYWPSDGCLAHQNVLQNKLLIDFESILPVHQDMLCIFAFNSANFARKDLGNMRIPMVNQKHRIAQADDFVFKVYGLPF